MLSIGCRILTPCALLLGGFDGLHAGHMTLVEAAKRTALPVAITGITGVKAGGNVFTEQEREIIFREAGISCAAELSFTEELKNTSAEEFLAQLLAKIPAKAIFCGEDFRFGKGALGTPTLLKELCSCPVTVLPLKTENGEKVSVTAIKRLLDEGRLPAVNRLLFHGYFIGGVVEHGRRVGRTYGFPTANLTFPSEKHPVRDGVYRGRVVTPCGEYPSIIHFGARPTFGVTEKKIEAYLDGFSGDLYGASVRVYPEEFLRPVQTFSSPQELREQLARDRECLKH